MLYRETGQFKTSYQADAAIFPIRQDRIDAATLKKCEVSSLKAEVR